MTLIIEGKECACLGDPTSHGSPLAPGVGALTVLYNGRPIWRVGVDFHACPIVKGVVPDVGGVVAIGALRTMVMGAPAARKTDIVVEVPGGPNPIIPGMMGVGGMAGQVMDAVVGGIESFGASVVEAFESPAVQGVAAVAATAVVAVVAGPELLAGAAIVEGAELAVAAVEGAEVVAGAAEVAEGAAVGEGIAAEGAEAAVESGEAAVGGDGATVGEAGDTGGGSPVDDTPASTPVGRSGNPMKVPGPNNAAGNVAGRDYSGHAFDEMQSDGIPPSAVENTIQNGEPSLGRTPGTTKYYDPDNNISAITNDRGRVITVYRGGR